MFPSKMLPSFGKRFYTLSHKPIYDLSMSFKVVGEYSHSKLNGYLKEDNKLKSLLFSGRNNMERYSPYI